VIKFASEEKPVREESMSKCVSTKLSKSVTFTWICIYWIVKLVGE